MPFTIALYGISTVVYLAYLFLHKDKLQKLGYYLLLAGFLYHTTTIGYGFIKAGHLPVENLCQTLSFAGWALAGMFLVLRYRYHIKVLGIYAAPLLCH